MVDLTTKSIAYHQRAEVCGEIQSIIGSSFMQKHDIGDDCRLRGLPKIGQRWKTVRDAHPYLSDTSSNTIENTSTHEAIVVLRHGAPDVASQTNES